MLVAQKEYRIAGEDFNITLGSIHNVKIRVVFVKCNIL